MEDEFKMGWQATPGKEAQAKGEASWGARERKTTPCCGSQHGGGVYQGGWEMSWPDFEGSSVGWEQA